MLRRISAATLSALALVVAPAAVAVPGSTPDDGRSPRNEPPSTQVVTLLTGDRVRMTTRGGNETVTIQAAPRPDGVPVAFHQVSDGDRYFVIPSDVASLVPERLDRDLFDVERLADDGRTTSVPVIVQAAAPRSARALASADWQTLGVTPERTLESIGAVAGEISGGDPATQELLAALRAGPRARTSTPVQKVWLDRRVTPFDADSTPQIGAPEAWDAGYTGDGVTVGVVDTGVDSGHPDLDEGVVTAAQDFTGSGSTADLVGHGTHVASIIAGSGEASGGVNRGVAPDAAIVSAKVLGPDGGDLSWVIDGMEWAADQGADILNLSLGDPGNYTDGTDPGSLAVDALSEQYGLLAVAAAGNSGSEHRTIPTLGTATSALTVGAVDDDDLIAEFSSVGPRIDGAFKPDIAAPGVGIVAARAEGTTLDEPVDELHVAASGTSMAAPHVAGAAAVVRSARPELGGQTLKSVLMASAQGGPNTVWQEGSGRVWIPGALGQTVTTEPASLSFGLVDYPQEDAEPRTRTVTYRNAGTSDVMLDLELDLRDEALEPLPEGTATLSSESLTVPAGGTADVDVTVDPSLVGPGQHYGGAITATSADGAAVRTAVGFANERERYLLTVRATDVDGSPATTDEMVLLQGPELVLEPIELEFVDGVATLRVDPGRYYLSGFLETTDERGFPMTVTAVGEPELEITQDTTIELDARTAQPMTVSTHREADEFARDLTFRRQLDDGTFGVAVGIVLTGYAGEVGAPETFVLGSGAVEDGIFHLTSWSRLMQPVLDVDIRGQGGRHHADVPVAYVPGSVPVRGHDRARLVDAGSGTADELERARDAYALVSSGDLQAQALAAEAAGAAGLLVRSDTRGAVTGPVADVSIPVLTTDAATGSRLESRLDRGRVHLSLRGRVQPDYTYDAVFREEDRLPDDGRDFRVGRHNLAALEMDYRAMGSDSVVFSTPILEQDGFQGYGFLGAPVTAPTTRTEYVTTTDGFRWRHMVAPHAFDGLYEGALDSGVRAYRPGERTSDVWLAQAHHGGFLPAGVSEAYGGLTAAVRDFDSMVLELPYWVDDAGHAQVIPRLFQEDVRMRLWQGDELLLDQPETFAFVFDLPAGPTPYRLRLDTARDEPWWQRSTRVATEWEFSSEFQQGFTPLPLLQLDYGLTLDERNRGQRLERLELTVGHQAGSAPSRVEGLRLWASSDDGETWTPVSVRGDDGSFTAVVRAPRGAEHVSLRAEAWDAAGSRVTETVIRAYSIGG